ncbi:gamma-glutamyl-gamma-aminobutyrate hydrolase family protein [Actinoallomurus iriomotensis]|uniref:gamma-glutamyl-gamma-aminobutyrate hydrolase family protein n=1 Tax=Actinoallomurus iriomotensis TaxID=478107 RepID=UPI0025525F0A|nr:gamma-glutamyl-gamma-aminobutyrate hydrolase family protein [Actinoallomurus iriomotensis]
MNERGAVSYVAVSQRVVVDAHGTRNDALDRRWAAFLLHCGLLPLPLPNDTTAALAVLRRSPVRGVLLTGGNDLAAYGGDAPERDAAELALVDAAERRGLPLLGVCRGMQLLQHRFGVPLTRVRGHVAERQVLTVDGRERVANSYHTWAAMRTRPPLQVWATGPGKVIKAVRHENAPLAGIMWHPERMTPFAEDDRALFHDWFGASA